MKPPFNIENLLKNTNTDELFFKHGTFYKALMGIPADYLLHTTRTSPQLNDEEAEKVMETALDTLNTALTSKYPEESDDTRQRMVAVCLSDTTYAGAILPMGNSNFLTYAIAHDFKPTSATGVMPAAFRRMLKAMGPYIFYAVRHGQDLLEVAFNYASLGAGDSEASVVFLNHYIEQLTWIRKNDNGSPGLVEAARLLNNGIIGAINYAVDLKKSSPLSAQDKEKAVNLVLLLLHHQNVNILLMQRDGSNAHYSIREYIAIKITGKNERVVAINEEAIINTFLHGEDWAQHSKKFSQKTCIDNLHKHVSPNHSLISPAKWGAGIFALTVVIFACVEGGLWHSSFLNDLFKQALDMDEGELLPNDKKAGLFMFSALTAGLVTGAAAWGIARYGSTPKLSG